MKTSPIAIIYIALTIVFTVIGQLLVKRGMLGIGVCPGDLREMPAFLLRIFTNSYVVMGLGSAVIAAAAWTLAISRSDLSFAYPFMGLAIVLVLALSPLVFGECVPLNRWLGVTIVCVGLWIAAR